MMWFMLLTVGLGALSLGAAAFVGLVAFHAVRYTVKHREWVLAFVFVVAGAGVTSLFAAGAVKAVSDLIDVWGAK